ncbi:hypothetical protein E4634_12955 [Mangrovimicrobium sediminis]|uniref:Uncharacterized protein n=1 Tax=Mangrovimicrobium sediminis TaxID=2562682 RepID=A0A4Z0LZ96_9GAMM|nr:DUF6776 family protein [Haliea sp. SAOS-164]TGD72438.1 hypothetical protein E4634_12955 [Haliea sp. SAOS-164]
MLAKLSEFVVENMPQRTLRMTLLVLSMVSILMLAGAFYLGEQAAYSGMRLDPERYHAMQEELPALREQLAQLQGENQAQQTRAGVDKAALELLRKDLAAQEEQIASLEEGLRFYRSLMAPGEIAQGLSLRPLELVATAEEGTYAFRIVAQQEARKHNLLRGELTAELHGVEAGEEVVYPLAALSEDIEGERIVLRFRYFQSIEGTLRLPAGFEPQGLWVTASAREPSKMDVEERFPWRLKERFSNVGG